MSLEKTNLHVSSDNHFWAHNVKKVDIHIDEVPFNESGRGPGYFCIGCGRQMQAVKKRIKNAKSYFRHDYKIGQPKAPCTFNNESYAHKVAKMVIQTLKSIKVPPLYKYHPDPLVFEKILLEKSKIIVAHKVELEMQFYEDESGGIRWGRNQQFSANKHLLIQPDITFFNQENKPILFIEIEVRNKINEIKLAAIRRLKIDTVIIKIPLKSSSEIEKSFLDSSLKHWVYNNYEEATDYFQFSSGDPERVLRSIEIEGRVFEETYSCRAAQIGNLIRAIGKSLESESYRTIELTVRDAVQRLERNTTAENSLVSTLRSKIEAIERQLNSSANHQITERIKREITEYKRIESDLRVEIDRIERSIQLEKQSKEEADRGSESLREQLGGHRIELEKRNQEIIDALPGWIENRDFERNELLSERVQRIFEVRRIALGREVDIRTLQKYELAINYLKRISEQK